MTESPIHSLHGQYFTATICFDEVVGRISVKDGYTIYLCQDVMDGSEACRDFLGYKYAWYMTIGADPKQYGVFDLKILPPPTEYHALFQEIIEKRGPAWDEDGSYSVIPNEVLTKIRAFLDGIKVFDPKNLGK